MPNGTIHIRSVTLQELISVCGLVDLHQGDPSPSTYIGSEARRIDYIFGCHRTAATVARQGSLAYTEGPQSDHRGLYVDLTLEDILGDVQNTTMETPSSRTLYSGNPELVETYLEEVRKYYEVPQYEIEDPGRCMPVIKTCQQTNSGNYCKPGMKTKDEQ